MANSVDDDELDLLSTTRFAEFDATSSRGAPPGARVSESGPRRSLRPRQSYPATVSTKFTRKRTLSTSALRNLAQENAMKRTKIDDQKAQTEATTKKRDARDEARKKWLYCQRDVVEPMLPPNSAFFDNLRKEIEQTYGDGISFKPLHCFDIQPKLIKGGEMKDYQLEGLSFLVSMYQNGMNCILGDEYVPFLLLAAGAELILAKDGIREDSSGPHDPHLVICPLSVLSSWEAEAARWVPSMRVIRFHGPNNERERLKHNMRGDRNFDIMLTTYEAYVAEDQWFKSNRWTYCVLDEGHKIKNSDTLLAYKVQGLGSLYRLLLTGTPVQNNLGELWALLHWLLPTVFTQATQSLFNESFDIHRGSYAIPFLNAAKKLVSIIMLRRTKAVVAGDDVPPREELTVFIPLTETQRWWTYKLLTKLPAADLQKIFIERGGTIKLEREVAEEGPKEVLSQLKNRMEIGKIEGTSDEILIESGGTFRLEREMAEERPKEVLSQVENKMETGKIEGTKYKQMMNLLIQLRQVCDHPYLLRDAEPEPYGIAEHVVSTSSKLIAIDKLLAELLPTGERVLIFSFQQEKSPYKVFLISTKAGGLGTLPRRTRMFTNSPDIGINLTKATTVIMCDSDWNPQNDLQAIARAHRIGQTKVVKVYRLICQGSVEDQMLDRIRRKLFLSYKIMGSDNPTSSESTSLGSSELMDILRRGSSALSHSDSGMNLSRFLEASIADVLEHSRSLEKKRDVKIKSDLKVDKVDVGDEQLLLAAEEEERRLLSGVAQVQSRLFEGKVVGKSQTNADIAAEWRNLGKRAREDRTIKIGGMTFIASSITEAIVPPAPKPVKKAKKKFESEEWCIHCRDGGKLYSTHNAVNSPRLISADLKCIAANTTVLVATDPLPTVVECSSADYDRSLLLDYGPIATAYYIRCHDCIADYAENPNSLFWAEWTRDISQAEKKLEKRYAEAPRRALLAASVAGSGIVLNTPPEKLSIYPTPTPDILLVEEPSALEREIGVVRRRVTEVLLDTHGQIQGVVSRWIGIEHAIENRVKSIISPNESLTPGLLYVGVATLSGSILARNRMLATRLLLPPIFLFASAKHFLPQTTENFTSYLGSLEDTYFPTLSEKHAIASAHTQMAWERLKDASQNGREWVNRGAATAVDKIQEATGLKLNETLGWSQARLQRVQAKAPEVVKVSEKKITETKVTAEKALNENKGEEVKKVEENKRLV
ncbi:hypothetical protein C0995_011389 [Termitomyces sp. Mi166|nr:hypothetical protein C0995_011389 [Termitomyces sp. Mi166\